MTCRALLWCGQVRGEGRENDFAVCVQDLDLAYQAARRLGVDPADIWALVCPDFDLLPQGFDDRRRRAATLDALREVTAVIAKVSRDDDATLFVGANHGEQARGMLVYTPMIDPFGPYSPYAEPERLTPAILGECLEPIAGQQILLLGACYSGMFLSLATERRAVLSACDDTEIWSALRSGIHCSAFLTPIFEHWTGATLGGFAPPEPLSLDEAFDRVRRELRQVSSNGRPVTPVRAGTARWPVDPIPERPPPAPAPRRRPPLEGD